LFEAPEGDAFVEYPASSGKPLDPSEGEITWPEAPQWQDESDLSLFFILLV